MTDPKLRWLCRRGMRELDLLLTTYLETGYPRASDRHKAAFCELLTLADPELVAYLLGGEIPGDPALAHVVRDIRNRPQA